MADTINHTTHSANHTPEVWAGKALGYLPKYLNLANTVTTDFDFDEIGRYGNKVNIPVRGTLSANSKAVSTDVTLQQPTDSEVEVTLNNHYEVTFSPEDVARAFSKPQLLEGYMQDAAVVLAEKIEDSIAALYTSAGDTVDATSATSATFLDKLRQARRKLITQKVPKNEPLYAYMSEYAIEELLSTDQMDTADKAGSNRPLVEGAIARAAGFNIFESQMVNGTGSPTTHHNMVYSKDAMVFVPRALPNDAARFGGAKQTVVRDPQTGLSMRVTMSYNANALAPQITLDALWGVSTLRSEHLLDFQTQI